MTWEQLTNIYELRTAQLTGSEKKRAERGFADLENFLKQYFTAALDNPVILTDWDWRGLYWELLHEELDNAGYDALEKLRSIIKKAPYRAMAVAGNTDRSEFFEKEDVTFCAAHWLRKQGWETRDPMLLLFDAVDAIPGRKHGINFVGKAMASIETNTPDAFKARLQRVFFALLDELNKDPQMQTAIFFANDPPTRSTVMMYAPHLKKTGINIYMVKSVDEVEEL